MWDIIFYETSNGRCPVDEFLDTLNPKQEAKVMWAIDQLSKKGLGLGSRYIDYLGDGIYELRVIFAGDIFRVFTFHWYDNKIVLTHAFQKKTQKTPRRQLVKARQYRDDFLSRFEEE